MTASELRILKCKKGITPEMFYLIIAIVILLIVGVFFLYKISDTNKTIAKGSTCGFVKGQVCANDIGGVKDDVKMVISCPDPDSTITVQTCGKVDVNGKKYDVQCCLKG